MGNKSVRKQHGFIPNNIVIFEQTVQLGCT